MADTKPPVQGQFGGTNQRIYPTLLDENTYTYTEGLVYRSGYGCRVNGKLLSQTFNSPVVAILQLPYAIIVQTLASVYYCVTDSIVFPPSETLQANPNQEYLQANPNYAYLQPSN
jgi:hypothetical protein